MAFYSIHSLWLVLFTSYIFIYLLNLNLAYYISFGLFYYLLRIKYINLLSSDSFSNFKWRLIGAILLQNVWRLEYPLINSWCWNILNLRLSFFDVLLLHEIIRCLRKIVKDGVSFLWFSHLNDFLALVDCLWLFLSLYSLQLILGLGCWKLRS